MKSNRIVIETRKGELYKNILGTMKTEETLRQCGFIKGDILYINSCGRNLEDFYFLNEETEKKIQELKNDIIFIQEEIERHILNNVESMRPLSKEDIEKMGVKEY